MFIGDDPNDKWSTVPVETEVVARTVLDTTLEKYGELSTPVIVVFRVVFAIRVYGL